MKGVVEIYGTTTEGKKDLLYQGENMTTVGFSENIVDMLTLPSSIVSATNAQGYLNSKNYIVNAFSMSKSKDQFRKNQHAYSTTNLLHNSNLLNTSGWTSSNAVLTHVDVQGSEFGSSSFLLEATTSAGNLSQTIFYGGDDGGFAAPYFSATDFVFSVDMKMNRDDPPIQVSVGADGTYKGYSQLVVSGNGVVSGVMIEWDNSGVPTINDGDPFGPSLGGVKSIGGGWYRTFVYSKYNDFGSGNSGPTVAYIYPSVGISGIEVVEAGYSASGAVGSILINRPQLELGIHPTNYVETSSFQTSASDPGRDPLLAYSRLNSTPPYGTDSDGSAAINYYVVSDSGGPTVSGIYGGTLDKGVSAYIPSKNELIPYAAPEDRELTPGAITPVEEAFDVKILQGQNAACQHIWDRIKVSTYDGSAWSYSKSYEPYFGRHLAYVGTYTSKDNWVPSGSRGTEDQTDATKIPVQNWVHYVSANNVAGLATPLSSISIGARGLLSTSGTTESMPDMYGYISVLNNATLGGPGDTGDTAANWGVVGGGYVTPLIQSEIQVDFSSTGEVTYHMRLLNMSGNTEYDFNLSSSTHSDTPLLNIFGGVDVIGLWGFDLKKIREDAYEGNTVTRFPFVTAATDRARVSAGVDHPEDPYRRYKLYSKKVLTDNIVKNEGLGTSAGVFGYYKNLDLYWRLKFL